MDPFERFGIRDRVRRGEEVFDSVPLANHGPVYGGDDEIEAAAHVSHEALGIITMPHVHRNLHQQQRQPIIFQP